MVWLTVLCFSPKYKEYTTFMLIRHHTSVFTKRKMCMTSFQMPTQVEHLCDMGDRKLCQEHP